MIETKVCNECNSVVDERKMIYICKKCYAEMNEKLKKLENLIDEISKKID